MISRNEFVLCGATEDHDGPSHLQQYKNKEKGEIAFYQIPFSSIKFI